MAMLLQLRRACMAVLYSLLLVLITLIAAYPIAAQQQSSADDLQAVGSATDRYFDPAQGVSSLDLAQRALANNAELIAARLDVERARARVRQAGLRPNPTIDFEQSTGRFTGS